MPVSYLNLDDHHNSCDQVSEPFSHSVSGMYIRLYKAMYSQLVVRTLTSELRPRVIIIMKNNIAQSGATGIVLRPSGKTTNTRPGPGKYITMQCDAIHILLGPRG